MNNHRTARQSHADRLAFINEDRDDGEKYFQKMTFEQSESWDNSYWYMRREGWPHADAKQRAWDMHFTGFHHKVS